MGRIYLTILLLLMSLCSKSQNLDKTNIDNWLIATFPQIQLDDRTLYFIDGFQIDGEDDFCKILSKYEMEDIATINYVDSIITRCNGMNNLVIITTGEQNVKTIEETIETCKRLFKKRNLKVKEKINPEDKEPVLIINGEQIYFKECYNAIHKIKTKDIRSINYIEKVVSGSLYGTNAVNGLIIIKTRK